MFYNINSLCIAILLIIINCSIIFRSEINIQKRDRLIFAYKTCPKLKHKQKKKKKNVRLYCSWVGHYCSCGKVGK